MVNRFMVELRKEKYRLEKRNEQLRHELAMHKDDGSTKECPGCYMERLWEKMITEKDKQIKKLSKQYVDATAVIGCLEVKLAKLLKKSKKSGKA